LFGHPGLKAQAGHCQSPQSGGILLAFVFQMLQAGVEHFFHPVQFGAPGFLEVFEALIGSDSREPLIGIPTRTASVGTPTVKIAWTLSIMASLVYHAALFTPGSKT
jgi:hypothetical protein